LDQPAATPNERPPVPVGMHRKVRRRQQARRWARWVVIALVAASILLAVFVHKGLLGIAGLVGAVVVGYAMVWPNRWPLLSDDEDEVTAG
jgi:chromate transport protein ChrA